jgi:YHS domain-containing protein
MENVIDVVCGTSVDCDEAEAHGLVVRGVRPYFFCSQSCRREFEENRARYEAASPRAPDGKTNERYSG